MCKGKWGHRRARRLPRNAGGAMGPCRAPRPGAAPAVGPCCGSGGTGCPQGWVLGGRKAPQEDRKRGGRMLQPHCGLFLCEAERSASLTPHPCHIGGLWGGGWGGSPLRAGGLPRSVQPPLYALSSSSCSLGAPVPRGPKGYDVHVDVQGVCGTAGAVWGAGQAQPHRHSPAGQPPDPEAPGGAARGVQGRGEGA